MARDIKENLVNFWPLNGHTADLTGGNDGTWNGTEKYTTNIFGHQQADANNSVANNVEVSLVSLSGDSTVSFWSEGMSAFNDWSGIVSNQNSPADNNILVASDAYFYEQEGVSIVNTTLTPLTEAFWTFVKKDNGSTATVCVYRNGMIIEEKSFTVGKTLTFDIIGAHFASNEGNELSNLRVYNVALTGDEILKLYNETFPVLIEREQPFDRIPDVTDTSLKGAWLNKKTIATGKDLSSNNNDGTPTNVQWDKVGGDFNGTDSVIDINSAEYEFNANEDFSVALWIKPEILATVGLIGNKSGAGVGWDLRTIGTGRIAMIIGSSGGSKNSVQTDASLISTGKFQHIAFSYSGATANSASSFKCYIDGSEVGLSIIDDDSLDSISYTTNLKIANSPSGFFTGKLKDTRIYNEIKSPEFITSEYNKGVPDDSLQLQTLINDADDLSKNRNNGTSTAVVLGDGGEFDGNTSVINAGSDDSLDDIFSGGGTIIGWAKSDGSGGGGFGRIFDKGFTIILLNGTATSVTFRKVFNVTTGSWRFFIPESMYFHFAVTYNDSSADNNPLIYINGDEVSITETSSPVGTPSSDSSENLYIGNSSTTGRAWDGHIKDIKFYNEIKSAGFIADNYKKTRRYY